jgi:hypothetical protein
MGARVEIGDSRHAAITGPTRLHGAEVVISDLRAGASLILGALAADGNLHRPAGRTTWSAAMRTSTRSSTTSAPVSSASPNR